MQNQFTFRLRHFLGDLLFYLFYQYLCNYHQGAIQWNNVDGQFESVNFSGYKNGSKCLGNYELQITFSIYWFLFLYCLILCNLLNLVNQRYSYILILFLGNLMNFMFVGTVCLSASFWNVSGPSVPLFPFFFPFPFFHLFIFIFLHT